MKDEERGYLRRIEPSRGSMTWRGRDGLILDEYSSISTK